MDSLKKILDLMQNERGRVFITDLNGNPAYVIMPLAEYESFQKKKRGQGQIEELLARVSDLTDQTEELNRQITEAQVEEFEEGTFDEDNLERPSQTITLDETLYIEPIESNKHAD